MESQTVPLLLQNSVDQDSELLGLPSLNDDEYIILLWRKDDKLTETGHVSLLTREHYLSCWPNKNNKLVEFKLIRDDFASYDNEKVNCEWIKIKAENINNINFAITKIKENKNLRWSLIGDRNVAKIGDTVSCSSAILLSLLYPVEFNDKSRDIIVNNKVKVRSNLRLRIENYRITFYNLLRTLSETLILYLMFLPISIYCLINDTKDTPIEAMKYIGISNISSLFLFFAFEVIIFGVLRSLSRFRHPGEIDKYAPFLGVATSAGIGVILSDRIDFGFGDGNIGILAKSLLLSFICFIISIFLSYGSSVYLTNLASTNNTSPIALYESISNTIEERKSFNFPKAKENYFQIFSLCSNLFLFLVISCLICFDKFASLDIKSVICMIILIAYPVFTTIINFLLRLLIKGINYDEIKSFSTPLSEIIGDSKRNSKIVYYFYSLPFFKSSEYFYSNAIFSNNVQRLYYHNINHIAFITMSLSILIYAIVPSSKYGNYTIDNLVKRIIPIFFIPFFFYVLFSKVKLYKDLSIFMLMDAFIEFLIYKCLSLCNHG